MYTYIVKRSKKNNNNDDGKISLKKDYIYRRSIIKCEIEFFFLNRCLEIQKLTGTGTGFYVLPVTLSKQVLCNNPENISRPMMAYMINAKRTRRQMWNKGSMAMMILLSTTCRPVKNVNKQLIITCGIVEASFVQDPGE